MRAIAQKYIDEGEEKKAMAVAKNLLKVGVSIDIISTSTGLSKKVIEELML